MRLTIRAILVIFVCVSCQAKAPLAVLEFAVHPTGSPVADIAISPDEQSIAAIRQNGTLEVWDVTSHHRTTEITMAGDGRAIAFWKNDEIATTWSIGRDFPEDCAVMIWNLATKLPVAKLPMADGIEAHCVHVAGVVPLLISGGQFPQNTVFNALLSPRRREFKTIEVWSEEDVSQFATTDVNKSLRTEIELFHPKGEIGDYDHDVHWLATDPNGSHLIVVGENGGGFVTRFDMKNGKSIWQRTIPSDCVGPGAFCAHFAYLAICSTASRHNFVAEQPASRLVRILDLATGKDVIVFDTGHENVTAIASNQQLNIIATGGDDGIVNVWSPNDGGKIGSVTPKIGEITALKFIESRNQLVAGGQTGAICVYQLGPQLKVNSEKRGDTRPTKTL